MHPRFFILILLAIAPALLAHAEPDELALGKQRGYPIGSTASWYEGASGAQDPLPGQERNAFWRGVLQSLGGAAD